MKLLSSTDLHIARSSRVGTLRLETKPSRFGDTYVAISDEYGMIEVQNTMAEANARVAQCLKSFPI